MRQLKENWNFRILLELLNYIKLKNFKFYLRIWNLYIVKFFLVRVNLGLGWLILLDLILDRLNLISCDISAQYDLVFMLLWPNMT